MALRLSRVPAGLIFHASRCRSTLLSRLLATLPRTAVASEPPTIDDVLRQDWAPDAARAAFDALSPGGTERLFVKLDAWHAPYMPALRAAYPEVPFVFVYRDPAAIVASHLREPGRHTVPGMTPVELGVDCGLSRVEYVAAVVGAIMAAGVRGADSECLVLDGATLPGSFGAVLDHFSVPQRERELTMERVVSGQDAKQPQLPYTSQTPAPKANVRAAARRWASEPWEQLQRLERASC